VARIPSPIPRTFAIIPTSHAFAACTLVRKIPEDQLRETIINGREEPTDEIGTHDGYISKFNKDFVTWNNRVPTTKSLVAVCEIVDN
jgi:hypothetical protein